MQKTIDKYEELLNSPNIFCLLYKYIINSTLGVEYDFGYTIISKGTILYRIRKYDNNTDFSLIKEWNPPPMKKQNRCNQDGECALYLGSSEYICLLETNIGLNEKYVIGKYKVIKDIKVGSFIYIKPNDNPAKIKTGMILNMFLISLSRNNPNKDLFEFIDDTYKNKKIENEDVFKSNNFCIPYRISSLNQSYDYYKITNQLCLILKKRTPKGIRYSSCYIPLETIGIECSEYNLVLYEEGIKDVEFIDFEIKENKSNLTQKDVVKTLIEVSKDK